MSIFNSYTRGGQVAMHNLRMFKQVFFVTIWLSLFTGVATFSLMSWHNTTAYQWYLYQEKIIGTHFTFGNPADSTTVFTLPTGEERKVRLSDVLYNQWFRFEIFKFEKILGIEPGSV